jgi:hypothetical protein
VNVSGWLRGGFEILGIGAALVCGGCSWNDSPPPLHSRLTLERTGHDGYAMQTGLVDTNSATSENWERANVMGPGASGYGGGAGGVVTGGAVGGTSSTLGNTGSTSSGNVSGFVGQTSIAPLGATPTTSTTTGTGTGLGTPTTSARSFPGTTTGTVGTSLTPTTTTTTASPIGTTTTVTPGTSVFGTGTTGTGTTPR